MRRKREQLDLETEIAAANAKLSVLQSSDVGGSSTGSTDGMELYLEKKK